MRYDARMLLAPDRRLNLLSLASLYCRLRTAGALPLTRWLANRALCSR